MFFRVFLLLLISTPMLLAKAQPANWTNGPTSAEVPNKPEIVEVLDSIPVPNEGRVPLAKEDSSRAATRASEITGMGGMGMGMGGRGSQSPGYMLSVYPSRSTTTPFATGNGSEFGIVRQQLNLGMPLFMEGSNMVIGTLSVRHAWFDTEAILPDSKRAFPDTLTNASIGALYMHKFEDGWSGGFMVSVNSATDRPFNSIREVNPMFVGMARIPVVNQRDSWNFSLFYSPASQIAFPIPGVSYAWNYSPDFQWNIGIPMSLFWRFAPEWTYEFSYLPLTNINSRVTWKPLDMLTAYGSFSWQNEAYFLNGREDRNERFFWDEKRFEIGTIIRPYGNWNITVAGGYAFDRRFFRSKSFTDNNFDRINIGSGPYFSVQVGYNFGGRRENAMNREPRAGD